MVMSKLEVATAFVFLIAKPFEVPVAITIGCDWRSWNQRRLFVGLGVANAPSQIASCHSTTPSVPLAEGNVMAVAPAAGSAPRKAFGVIGVPPVPAVVRRRIWSSIAETAPPANWVRMIFRIRRFALEPAMTSIRWELAVVLATPGAVTV